MQNRGIRVPDTDASKRPILIDDQLLNIKEKVLKSQDTINSVIAILQEKRSFLDLQAELLVKSFNIELLEDDVATKVAISLFPKDGIKVAIKLNAS